MADVFTGAFGFTQPEIGGSPDTWGTKLNNNWGSLDDILAQFVGMVAAFPATGTVTGWLKMDGATVSRTTYARLYTFASTSGQMAASEGVKEPGEFGPGDGSTTFSLPNVLGKFIRAWDDGEGVDTGRLLGTSQDDQNLAHNHVANVTQSLAGGHDHSGATGSAGGHSHTGSTNTTGNHSHTYTRYAAKWGEGSGSEMWTSNGTYNTGTAGAHSHTFTTTTEPSHTHSIAAVADHTHNVGVTTDNDGGSEVRVKNVALAYYIKF